ncbi:MAG: chemotaxis protein CheW [Peptococcaceae bacterium]|jgi:purine-binding chemotaxis protein CheW|nr:chemotaxis protein CheW [Peptococcaceae bacterium]MDH7525882.1 chemotaxis protein CheW [Peptococcaceae bacterium]
MEEKQYVIFGLGDQEFGIDIMSVQEIIRPLKTTKLPNSPPHVLGVFNLREKVIPVVSLRRVLGFEDSASDEKTRVIVVKVEDRPYGLLVDIVHEVLRISSGDIEKGHDVYQDIDSRFVSGIARVEERLIILLNLSFVL